MTQIDRLLAKAIADIGYTESPPNSNKTKYGEAYGLNGYSWCLIAIWYWFREAGLSHLFYGGGKVASCSQYRDWAKKAGQWVTGDYRRGDLVIFDFPNTGVSTDHIGIVYAVTGGGLVTIEGNTSATGSQSNGGMVMQKTRSLDLVIGAIRPPYEDESELTDAETGIVKAIQAALGAKVDGEIKAQTLVDLAAAIGADAFPATVEIEGMPTIAAKNIVPFAPNAPLAYFGNVISGSFHDGSVPCSVLVQDGKVRRGHSCHASHGKPESVMYRLWDGTVGLKRVISTDELPTGLRWAVGGLGLLDNYDPVAEGFTKLTTNGKTEDFSDVLRDTNHTMLGYRNGVFYLVYCKSMTAAQVNEHAKALGLELAVMLDGGHVAAINGAEDFAKININQKQLYAIQGERVI